MKALELQLSRGVEAAETCLHDETRMADALAFKSAAGVVGAETRRSHPRAMS
jgi:hypothetical protein